MQVHTRALHESCAAPPVWFDAIRVEDSVVDLAFPLWTPGIEMLVRPTEHDCSVKGSLGAETCTETLVAGTRIRC
jgi:hypothetical protein